MAGNKAMNYLSFNGRIITLNGRPIEWVTGADCKLLDVDRAIYKASISFLTHMSIEKTELMGEPVIDEELAWAYGGIEYFQSELKEAREEIERLKAELKELLGHITGSSITERFTSVNGTVYHAYLSAAAIDELESRMVK